MAALQSQCSGLRCASLSFPFLSKRRSSPSVWRTAAPSPANVGEIVCAARIGRPVAITHEQKERQALKKIFEEAAERIRTSPMEGVPFTLEEFKDALKKLDFNIKIGSKVKGTVCMTDTNGAFVDVRTKSTAFLPLYEACLYRINHVSEAGIHPGFTEEFVVVGEKANDNTWILSLRSIQYNLAWERCKQLQAEDAIVKGKVVGGNKGGVVVSVEGIRGFVPFSLISTKLTAEELLDKELPLKIVELDEKQSKLILSNRKAVPVSQAQLETGSVVLGTVQSLKPYGAFIDVGGINGLLHISQISHDRITDISTVLHLGDTIKVMILSYDRDKGRLSLSTKKLEPTPGDMIHNPKLVFEKADDMAWAFRQRIAQAEALARADMLRFQPESESSFSSSSIFESIFRPLSPDPSPQCLHSSDEPSAEDGASVSKDNGE